jgi:Nuclear RNA-splicing-associated protein
MESVVPTTEQPLPLVVAQQHLAPKAKAKPNDRMMIPMTMEAWERQQAQVRHVYDEESGRYRLVKGSGEIVERIVSKTDHAAINQTATRGDGSSFARSILARVKK